MNILAMQQTEDDVVWLDIMHYRGLNNYLYYFGGSLIRMIIV